jgi:hypothetical protein
MTAPRALPLACVPFTCSGTSVEGSPAWSVRATTPCDGGTYGVQRIHLPGETSRPLPCHRSWKPLPRDTGRTQAGATPYTTYPIIWPASVVYP